MDGILNVHKSNGPTSHDVVDEVRRLFGQKRVGHAGTLDPMATGVLVVCLGKGTRVVEYLMGTAKEYRARMVMGISTDTQDSTGAVLAESDASAVTRESLKNAIGRFVGEIEQVPPMTSAIKHQGKALYKLAREGKTVERKARKVEVTSIRVTEFTPGERAEAEIVVNCGSGTYIRTLCSDIGDALGCGANMSMLERTRVGRFAIEDAVTIPELVQARSEGRLEECVTGISDALGDMPSVELGSEDVSRVLHGIPVRSAMIGDGLVVRILGPDGELIGLGEVAGDMVRPKKVLADAAIEAVS